MSPERRVRMTEKELVPSVPVRVADCDAVRIPAVAENAAVEAPEATVTFAGANRAELFVLVKATAVPPDGEGWFKVIEQVEAVPEAMVVGVHTKLISNTGAVTEIEAEAELVPSVAVTVADWGVVNLAAVAWNVAVEAPVATITEAGMEMAVVLVLVRATAAPPDGAD